MLNRISMFENYNKQLHVTADFNKAVQGNDLSKLKEICEGDVLPNINLEIITVAPILLAAQNGYWDIVEYLFELGVDLDVMTIPHKWHLIHECVSTAPLYLLKNIANFANVNTQTSTGQPIKLVKTL